MFDFAFEDYFEEVIRETAGVSSTTGSPSVTTGVTFNGLTGTVYQWTANGSITFNSTGDVYYLIVAGGGGGGSATSSTGASGPAVGGGGAGGVVGGLTTSKFSGTASTYTITVGQGGQRGTGAQLPGNGGNSSITGTNAPAAAVGGGAGGYGIANDINTQSDGKAGGSGGGGAAWWKAGAGGAATSGQGTAGGVAIDSYPNSLGGGGGGGAGSAGGAGQWNRAGNGGNGIASSITGTSVTYAGGGAGAWAGTNPDAGAVGGTGGGGARGVDGTDGLGGGGGGAAAHVGGGTTNPLAGRGGHGTVIIFVEDSAEVTNPNFGSFFQFFGAH